MIPVAVIDPQFVFRQLLRLYLTGPVEDFVITGESSLGQDALRLCESSGAALLLADYSVADLPCAEIVTRIRRHQPQVRVLLMAADYVPGLREAVEAGAHGCVLKTEPLETFVAAMRVVAGGGAFFSPRLPASRSRASLQLTPRQHQTLALIAAGLSTKEVADRLQISFKTADHHRTRMMKRLNLHDLASLVRFAIRSGVTEC